MSEYLVIKKEKYNASQVVEKAINMMRGLGFSQETIDKKYARWSDSSWDGLVEDIEETLEGYVEFQE